MSATQKIVRWLARRAGLMIIDPRRVLAWVKVAESPVHSKADEAYVLALLTVCQAIREDNQL